MPPFSWNDVPQQNTSDDDECPAHDLTPIPIEDSIDLHTFQPRDVKPLLDEYLRECRARGFTEVRIIHGRGTGALRKTVQSVLARHPLVVNFKDAPPERGGWGATIARLTAD